MWLCSDLLGTRVVRCTTICQPQVRHLLAQREEYWKISSDRLTIVFLGANSAEIMFLGSE